MTIDVSRLKSTQNKQVPLAKPSLTITVEIYCGILHLIDLPRMTYHVPPGIDYQPNSVLMMTEQYLLNNT